MNHVTELAAAGTSVWLDDLSRDRLDTGNLAELIADSGIVGVTTNPAIFAKAMSVGTAYDAQVAELKAAGSDVSAAVFSMAVQDVRNACDVFSEVYESSDGVDGRVSIEVDPGLADDREGTVAQARQLYMDVARENVMIKIPATEACLPAITEVLADGISVNVTLIFSVERYRQVIAAFVEGIAQAQANGQDISKIHSVASFFVSRVDTEIDRRLDEIGTAAALAVRGKAGLANARLAYEAFESELRQDSRWQQLEAAGAHPQRPLWASTGVKNPDYPDTLYVTGLVGPDTVNTMPEDTLNATLDHATVSGDTLSGTGEDSREIFAALEDLGVDLKDVFLVLEHEGVDKFVSSWQELLDTIGERL